MGFYSYIRPLGYQDLMYFLKNIFLLQGIGFFAFLFQFPEGVTLNKPAASQAVR